MAQFPLNRRRILRNTLTRAAVTSFLAVALTVTPFSLLAQSAGQSQQKQQSGQTQTQGQTPSQTAEQKPDTPAAGGPSGDIGPIAVPKRKPQEDLPVEKPKPPKNPEGLENFSLRVDVPLVNLDALITTKDGMFIPGLKKDQFRVIEDGVPQQLTDVKQTEAPITAVLLVEFASTNYYFMYDALNASYSFADSLKKEDWVAVVSYDMKPYMHVDFTQDKRAVYGALGKLRIPGFSETNLFDALYDTIDRLEGVEGRKYIVLISSGRDTFSKLNYDQILKKVKNSRDITIYAISTGQAIRNYYDNRGAMGSITRLDYLQADNQMNTFAKMTGGRAYFPKFESEMRGIFGDIANSIRNQYTITYKPTNTKQDGTWRKVKIELVDPANGQPLKIVDQKGKNLKYNVIARDGYQAKNVVE